MLGPGTEEGGVTPQSAEREEPLRILMASPVGRLGIEFRGKAVTRLVIQPSRKDAKSYTPLDKVKMDDFLLEALGRLSEYFAGVRKNPGIDVDLDANDLDEVSLRVLTEVRRVPYGRTWSYKRLAETAGLRDGYNLVRSILNTNPVPILVPCHRIVPNKGGSGTWIGGPKKKEKLLKIEAKGAKNL